MTRDHDSLKRDIQERQRDLQSFPRSLRNVNPFLVNRPHLTCFFKETSHSELFYSDCLPGHGFIKMSH